MDDFTKAIKAAGGDACAQARVVQNLFAEPLAVFEAELAAVVADAKALMLTTLRGEAGLDKENVLESIGNVFDLANAALWHVGGLQSTNVTDDLHFMRDRDIDTAVLVQTFTSPPPASADDVVLGQVPTEFFDSMAADSSFVRSLRLTDEFPRTVVFRPAIEAVDDAPYQTAGPQNTALIAQADKLARQQQTSFSRELKEFFTEDLKAELRGAGGLAGVALLAHQAGFGSLAKLSQGKVDDAAVVRGVAWMNGWLTADTIDLIGKVFTWQSMAALIVGGALARNYTRRNARENPLSQLDAAMTVATGGVLYAGHRGAQLRAEPFGFSPDISQARQAQQSALSCRPWLSEQMAQFLPDEQTGGVGRFLSPVAANVDALAPRFQGGPSVEGVDTNSFRWSDLERAASQRASDTEGAEELRRFALKAIADLNLPQGAAVPAAQQAALVAAEQNLQNRERSASLLSEKIRKASQIGRLEQLQQTLDGSGYKNNAFLQEQLLAWGVLFAFQQGGVAPATAGMVDTMLRTVVMVVSTRIAVAKAVAVLAAARVPAAAYEGALGLLDKRLRDSQSKAVRAVMTSAQLATAVGVELARAGVLLPEPLNTYGAWLSAALTLSALGGERLFKTAAQLNVALTTPAAVLEETRLLGRGGVRVGAVGVTVGNIYPALGDAATAAMLQVMATLLSALPESWGLNFDVTPGLLIGSVFAAIVVTGPLRRRFQALGGAPGFRGQEGSRLPPVRQGSPTPSTQLGVPPRAPAPSPPPLLYGGALALRTAYATTTVTLAQAGGVVELSEPMQRARSVTPIESVEFALVSKTGAASCRFTGELSDDHGWHAVDCKDDGFGAYTIYLQLDEDASITAVTYAMN